LVAWLPLGQSQHPSAKLFIYWKNKVWQMLIYRIFFNIPFFPSVIIFFEKIIFLKFWHSILELFSADLQVVIA
jgi:hypothetical protein